MNTNSSFSLRKSEMNKAKKVLLQYCLGAGFCLLAGNAAADDNSILFKIHDITPVRNSDGLVTSCDVGATFYSRLQNDVSNVSLRLSWIDDVVNETIAREERAQKEATRLRRTTSRYSTASFNSKNIVLNLKLPTIRPDQQVTLKTKVNTDRCFLLMNDPEISVTNCGTGNSAANKNSGVSCANMFRFVSVKDPEYYTEFQSISLEELKKQEEIELVEQKNEIDKAFNEAIDAVNALTAELTAPALPDSK